MRAACFVGLKLLMVCFLVTSTASAENFFPLYPGSRWTYQANTGEVFQITVALNPISFLDGRVYHRVSGYASKPLFVRSDENGVLYRLNEESQQDEILADFRPSAGEFYSTPISDPCGQDAQAQKGSVVLQWGGMSFSAAREIRYRIYNCADTGIWEELYLENIGLVQRTVQTFAGPRVFTLVSGNVGPLTLNQMPGVNFRVSLFPSSVSRRDAGDLVETSVTLRLLADRAEPVLLLFRSSQRYDIAIKNEKGEIVYLWSSTALFAQVLSTELVTSKEYTELLSLNLPDGNYTVEAWLTTDSDNRQFAGTAALSVHSVGSADRTK